MSAQQVGRFNCWMQLPQLVHGRRPWSLISQNITAEQAETYRSTLLFPVHVEAAEAEHSQPGETE